MTTVIVTFLDGSTETVQGYRVYADGGVLYVRTSHSGAYTDTYVRYPLTSIRKWETR